MSDEHKENRKYSHFCLKFEDQKANPSSKIIATDNWSTLSLLRVCSQKQKMGKISFLAKSADADATRSVWTEH